MAKRKQTPPSLHNEALRWGATALVTAVSLFLAVQAVSAFLHHAKTFVVKDVSFSAGLEEISVPELERLKGRNIFAANLAKVEEKLRAKYPRIGGIKVIRRFPNEILVSGFMREAVAVASVNGRLAVVSRDGCFMGAPAEDTAGLVRLKGLNAPRSGSGTSVNDPQLFFAYTLIDAVRAEEKLASIGFRSIDIHDPEKIVCVFGEGKNTFEVFLNQARAGEELDVLKDMVERVDLDFSGVRYIDLRFKQPVIGQKKKRK